MNHSSRMASSILLGAVITVVAACTHDAQQSAATAQETEQVTAAVPAPTPETKPPTAAAAAALAPPALSTTAGKFVDVTKESGVAEIVEKHYVLEPKLWLSGTTPADFDGDGDLDLAIGGHGYVGSFGQNDGRGHFTWVDPKVDTTIENVARDGLSTYDRQKIRAAEVPYPGGEIRMVFDYDEDGKLDALGAYGDDAGVAYLNNTSVGPAGTVWNFKAFKPGFVPFSRGTSMADMNRDGLVDYLYNSKGLVDHETHSNTVMSVFYGKPSGGSAKWEVGPLIPALFETTPIPVDLNGDGHLDLVLHQGGYHPKKRMILLNDGQMNFKNVTVEAGLGEDGSISGVGDANQDGKVDIMCPDGLYAGDGQGRFSKTAAVEGTASPFGGNAVVTDLDNDGIADIISGSVLRGLGGGKFEPATSQWGARGGNFGDLDNDGMLDTIASSRGQRGVGIYHNGLPRQHWINVQLVGAKGNRAGTNAQIRIYEAGGINDPARLIWYENVLVWGRQNFHNYYFAKNTERHFGLGKRQIVDVSVEFYPSGKKVEAKGVAADGTKVISEQ